MWHSVKPIISHWIAKYWHYLKLYSCRFLQISVKAAVLFLCSDLYARFPFLVVWWSGYTHWMTIPIKLIKSLKIRYFENLISCISEQAWWKKNNQRPRMKQKQKFWQVSDFQSQLGVLTRDFNIKWEPSKYTMAGCFKTMGVERLTIADAGLTKWETPHAIPHSVIVRLPDASCTQENTFCF